MPTHQQVVAQPDTPYCFVSPEEMEKALRPYGVRKAAPEEIVPALHLGEQMIGRRLARAEVVYTIDSITGMSVWVTGTPVSGFYVTVPLTKEGRAAVEAGHFTPDDPELCHVAPAKTPIFGSYLGIYAGATTDARRAIMTASVSARLTHFPNVPCYARAATARGEQAMRDMGFHSLPGILPTVFVLESES